MSTDDAPGRMTDARAWGLLTASGMAAIATTLVTLLRAGELDDLAAALDATRDR